MAEAARIGEGKFATPLELLEGERVLWSGGAELRGGWINLGRLMLVIGLPMLFLIAMVSLPILTDSADEAEAETTTQVQAKDCPEGAQPDCASPSDASPTKRARTKASSNSKNNGAFYLFLGLVASFFGLCLLYGLSLMIDCFLRVRHAWYVITSERICIQSGGWSRSLAVMDLDKVISVKAESTWYEARMGLQTIELTHAGGTQVLRNAWQFLLPNPYAIAHVPTAGPLLSELVNHWLPRDDRHSSRRA